MIKYNLDTSFDSITYVFSIKYAVVMVLKTPLKKKLGKTLDYICKISYNTMNGEDREKDPPVLIPNTEVKLLIAEDTWLETARKIRTLPFFSLRPANSWSFCIMYLKTNVDKNVFNVYVRIAK